MRIVKAALAAIAMTVSATSWAADDVVVIYDASGSMWGQIDGVSKIEIAREVMADLVNKWDDDTNLGLVAYGHRRQGDCSDIETLVEPGPLDKASFIKAVNAIKPVGKTPIGASLQHAADLLSYRDSQATIILISDGLETCHADPCAVSEQLAKQGVKLTAHVVGFDLEAEVHANLSCIADNTGGIFVPANNAAELHDALAQVQSAMDQEAAPEPEPEAPALPEVEITAPEQVTTGAPFSISWSDVVASNDYYTIVPVGTEEGKTASRNLVGDKNEGSLKAPAEPGLYEVRYVLREGMKTLASTPVEVVEAELSISAPEQVTTGAPFQIRWSDTIATNDYYTIVPVGTEEGKTASRNLVGDKNEGSLKAPAEPGLYEVRYVLREGMKTLASTPVEVVEAELSISAPEVVRAGTAIKISWSDTVATNDYYTIVPAGTEEGKTASRNLVGDKNEGSLKAPAEPGLYEVRYVLREGMKTLASAPVEVVAADAPLDDGAGLSVPKTAAPGETITITWSGGSDSADQRISLARKDQPDFSWISVQSVGDEKTMDLTMPDETGTYEIRFLDIAGRQLLGRSIVEVR
ncbi:MAG TPA: VWA domain-containing protein [Guyparkeria sp.]|nr:VWA domain-containing protein [Guyparkeria sp.]